ncbi:MAG TPA: hypothetical protein VJ973_04890 [Christiangramia sp.]|nr:hypothetical protein [Christiangramia sp.]
MKSLILFSFKGYKFARVQQGSKFLETLRKQYLRQGQEYKTYQEKDRDPILIFINSLSCLHEV